MEFIRGCLPIEKKNGDRGGCSLSAKRKVRLNIVGGEANLGEGRRGGYCGEGRMAAAVFPRAVRVVRSSGLKGKGSCQYAATHKREGERNTAVMEESNVGIVVMGEIDRAAICEGGAP